jgi:signal transduction histidine kinase
MSAAEARSRIAELSTALAARDRFIALLGHELRNSLAPTVLLAEQFSALANDPRGPVNVTARARKLAENLNKLIAAVDRVADITDLRRGKLQLDPTRIDLVEIVDEVCRESQREADFAGAVLMIMAEDSIDGKWDRARVKQIVANLVANAIRHSGGGRIEILVRGDASQAEIVIEDEGPGIDASLLPRLFEFTEQGTARGSGRHGIGLWVVKTLCSAMQGTVAVDNRPSGGARFSVTLPRG